MIGFGFMDQTVMIQSGNAIDLTIGVSFGLSTLTAAALGQVVSAAAAALFGGTIDSVFRSLGLPRSGLSSAQRALPQVKRINVMGNLVGVVFGCLLGLVNLLFIDTEQSSMLKLNAMAEANEFAYEIEASNTLRKDATTITVRGPDVHGLLASITTALLAQNCCLKEVHALSSDNNHDDGIVDDVLVVSRDGQQIPNDELRDLASALREATTTPLNVHTVRAQAKEIEEMRDRIQKLESIIQERQIKIQSG
jgi:hypothetical protein